MLDKHYLSPREACERLLVSIAGRSLKTEEVSLLEGLGRVLATDIIAPEDLPSFARSTVDGYAVQSRDTFGAKEQSPAYLTLAGEVSMGAAPDVILQPGGAARIPTGGMLPEGSDAVVMLEHVHAVSPDLIEVTKPAAHMENVIRRGEDVAKGERVLRAGRQLLPQDVGALAGLGIVTIRMFMRPVVAIISTGDEIVPPSCAASQGQVRDINSYTLAGLISQEWGIAHLKGIFRDSYDVIRSGIEDALKEADIVLISGGTSAGMLDMTSQIINDIGTPGVLFHGVALKPGKPTIGAAIGTSAVLGLPGHPAAVAVAFNLFVKPLIAKLSGRAAIACQSPGSVRAFMTKAIASAAGREDHIRVALEEREGVLHASPILGKSGLISTLVKADGTVVIAAEKLGLDSGEEVTVFLF